jgi:hypothetical protein
MEMIGLLIAAAEGNKDEGEAWIGIIVLVVVLGIILVIAIGSRLREKKRTGRLEVVVAEMGLEFRSIGDPELLGRLGVFPLMNVGRSQELKNLILGDTSQGQLALFDFRYVTGHGKHKKTHRQSVLAMEAPELQQLPVFNMRPEGFWDKVGGVFGMQDVDFDDHVEFSKQFVLKGESEEELRPYMDRDLLDFFAARPGVCCEARPGVFLYYRRRKRVAPEAELLQGFLEEGMMVFVALMERQIRG